MLEFRRVVNHGSKKFRLKKMGSGGAGGQKNPVGAEWAVMILSGGTGGNFFFFFFWRPLQIRQFRAGGKVIRRAL